MSWAEVKKSTGLTYVQTVAVASGGNTTVTGFQGMMFVFPSFPAGGNASTITVQDITSTTVTIAQSTAAGNSSYSADQGPIIIPIEKQRKYKVNCPTGRTAVVSIYNWGGGF